MDLVLLIVMDLEVLVVFVDESYTNQLQDEHFIDLTIQESITVEVDTIINLDKELKIVSFISNFWQTEGVIMIMMGHTAFQTLLFVGLQIDQIRRLLQNKQTQRLWLYFLMWEKI